MNNIDQYRDLSFADVSYHDELTRQLRAIHRMAEREAWRYQEERESLRAIEDRIMANPLDYNPGVVGQIRDHRENGNYTTCHR